MATGTAVEQRVARLEGTYDHLATKADIAELRGKLNTNTVILAAIQIVLAIILKVT